MNTLTVNGIHCDACTQLIKMELEDASLLDNVESITAEENNRGKIIIKENASEEIINRIKQVINAMDNYSTE